jgi:hypothetical protein
MIEINTWEVFYFRSVIKNNVTIIFGPWLLAISIPNICVNEFYDIEAIVFNKLNYKVYQIGYIKLLKQILLTERTDIADLLWSILF